MVFFDVLGLTMVAYPARVGSIINYMVAIATLIYLAKKCLRPSNVGKYRHTKCPINVPTVLWVSVCESPL